MPRVIAGSAGGRPLRTPRGEQTRPTAERTKEAVFSAVEARMSLRGARVLDLFAGSGQLGIEALSRGAEVAVFVERDGKTAELIRQNLATCGLSERAIVRRMSVPAALEQLMRQQKGPEDGFDLVLMDPPYREASTWFRNVVELFGRSELLRPDALLVFEYAAGMADKRALAGAKQALQTPAFRSDVTYLKPLKHCKYGTSMVSFFMYTQLKNELC